MTGSPSTGCIGLQDPATCRNEHTPAGCHVDMPLCWNAKKALQRHGCLWERPCAAVASRSYDGGVWWPAHYAQR